MMLVSRPSSGQLREGLKKILNLIEFSKLARPPLFLKVIKNDSLFDLWHLKISGVTFNDWLFWSGEVEGEGH